MASIDSVLERLYKDPLTKDNFTASRTIPASEGLFDPYPQGIHPSILQGLSQEGITALYSHQKMAWELAEKGENFAVITGTASGKTLCYNLPIINRLIFEPQSRALYIFPTKALAHDQLSKIKSLLINCGFVKGSILPAAYDGDTPPRIRADIRAGSQLILSNPDMLHTGILPRHPQWSLFFENLNFVVIDEMHTYRGVFGSHVANVIRRLRRIAGYYGASPQFFLTSATIGNPQQLAESLTACPVQIIDTDGSQRGEKHFLIYNPPIIDRELGIRASLIHECVNLSQKAFDNHVQTIIFGRSRRAVEVLLSNMRAAFSSTSGSLSTQIRAYRSGYLPKKRREIEKGLRNGDVRIVVATTALELGIDIGNLDLAILAGYPGTISGTWQQAGRAGRKQANSAAILIASSNLIDQYLANKPEFFFGQSPEKALINPHNLLIILDHIKCALFELPFSADDGYGDLDAETTCQFLEFIHQNGGCYKADKKYYWMSDQFPSGSISLRNATGQRYILQDISQSSAETIGEIDGESIYWMVHPQAVYLHEGDAYIVTDLDDESHTVSLYPSQVDYFTRAKQETEISILETISELPFEHGSKAYGEISVISQVIGFQKLKNGTLEDLGFFDLSLPSTKLQTNGSWIKIDQSSIDQLRDQGLWNNDPNDYGPTWRVQREKALERDHYICQVCGLSGSEKLLHIHHKTPFRKFSSAITANSLDNLVTLCPACHRRVESRFRIRSGLAGFGFVLGNLAPLFVMCDARDIGVFTDPRSIYNDGAPLVAIYDMVPGGIGFSQSIYDTFTRLLTASLELVEGCSCKDGCPGCVGPGGEFGLSGKTETIALVKLLLGQ